MENNKGKDLHIIHVYLDMVKVRMMILAPPLILCIIGFIVAFIQVCSNFSFTIPPIVRWTFIGSAIWMLLGLFIVLWSDYKRNDYKYGKYNN